MTGGEQTHVFYFLFSRYANARGFHPHHCYRSSWMLLLLLPSSFSLLLLPLPLLLITALAVCSSLFPWSIPSHSACFLNCNNWFWTTAHEYMNMIVIRWYSVNITHRDKLTLKWKEKQLIVSKYYLLLFLFGCWTISCKLSKYIGEHGRDLVSSCVRNTMIWWSQAMDSNCSQWISCRKKMG